MQGRPAPFFRAISRLLLPSAALCIAAGVLLPAPRAAAAPGGTLSMNPPTASLQVGDTLSITFDVTGGVNINEVHLGVTFNSAVVQAQDASLATPGTQILPGAFPGTDTEGAVVQNTVSSGIINYQFEMDGAAEVDGDGTVATVQFAAIANGNANIAWTVRTFRDASDVSSTPAASSAVVVVGGSVPPVATETPGATDTPSSTATAGASATPTPSATSTAGSSTPEGSVTATATRTPTRTPSPTSTAGTETPQATATARITILQNPNASPTPDRSGQTLGVDPSQADRARGLPAAGNEGGSIQWWRWTFFASALMLGAAGWFFTFAVHYGDRDVVLMDRFDARRKRLSRRKLR